MGLNITIYRDSYDSKMNVFHGKKGICLTNVAGPFEPSEDYPAGKIIFRENSPYIIPVDDFTDSQGVQMNGGTFGYTSDSRFSEATGLYSALPIHDRRESWAEYDAMSR